MLALRVSDSGNGFELSQVESPRPQPAEGELLIQVYAAGITSRELDWYPTTHNKDGSRRTGAIPGHEFSGVIVGVEKPVAGFQVGAEVYGMNDWFTDGATAEFCVTEPSSVALKPKTLTHAKAASVPISALTAWQGLFDRAKLQPGERVLVQGAGGAVGLFVVQLAHLHGAEVIATASARHIGILKQLGAGEVIDYRASGFEQIVSDVDVVFDTVGGAILARSWNVLKPTGRIVTVAAASEGEQDERTKQAFFIVEPNRDQLSKIGRMIETGDLRTFVDVVVPLAQAAAAYRGEVPGSRGLGKRVVAIREG